MMDYSEEVKRLAETLKSSGLAASMRDALERAQSMVGDKEGKEAVKEEPFKKKAEKKIDGSQTTLGKVKAEEKEIIDESSEEGEELKKEEVFTNNPNGGEKVNEEKDSKEKKVDLSDVFNVNKKS